MELLVFKLLYLKKDFLFQLILKQLKLKNEHLIVLIANYFTIQDLLILIINFELHFEFELIIFQDYDFIFAYHLGLL